MNCPLKQYGKKGLLLPACCCRSLLYNFFEMFASFLYSYRFSCKAKHEDFCNICHLHSTLSLGIIKPSRIDKILFSQFSFVLLVFADAVGMKAISWLSKQQDNIFLSLPDSSVLFSIFVGVYSYSRSRDTKF